MFNLIKLYKCILQIITQSKIFPNIFCFNVDKYWLMKSREEVEENGWMGSWKSEIQLQGSDHFILNLGKLLDVFVHEIVLSLSN